MKKLVLFLLAVIVTGCSGLPNLPPLLASPTLPPPTETPTFFASATPIPTDCAPCPGNRKAVFIVANSQTADVSLMPSLKA